MPGRRLPMEAVWYNWDCDNLLIRLYICVLYAMQLHLSTPGNLVCLVQTYPVSGSEDARGFLHQ